jgi:hypothetical protein
LRSQTAAFPTLYVFAFFVLTLPGVPGRLLSQALRPTGPNDQAVKRVLSVSGASAPAIQADALLMLTDLEHTADARWRKAEIQRAFQLAAAAPQQYATTPVPIGFTDSIPAAVALSSERKVDGLSLRLRAVQAMLELDSALGRRMFAETKVPPLPHLTCQDLMVPDLRLYYAVAAEVAQRAFAPEEIRGGLQASFLLSYIRDLQSPLQVFPVSTMLTAVNLDPSHFAPLLSALADEIRSIHGDDRAFTVAFLREEATHELPMVMRLTRGAAVAPEPLLAAFAQFYEQQLNAPHRCQDTATSVHLVERETDGIKTFNALLAQYGVKGSISTPVQHIDLAHAARAADPVRASPEYRTLLVRFQPSKLVPNDDIQVAGKAALLGLVHDIDAWGPPANLEREAWFILKRDLLVRAVRAAAPYQGFYAPSDAYIRFLEQTADLRTSELALWLDALSQFLHLSHERGVEWTTKILKQLDSSHDPVIALYGDLDGLIERLNVRGLVGN